MSVFKVSDNPVNPLTDREFAMQAENTALRAKLAELEADAKRYRWLAANVEPEYSRKPINSEFFDYNMKWQIKPYLVAVTAVASDVSFNEAVDMAMKGTPS